MNCIIVNDDFLQRKLIEKLIFQSEKLVLLTTFDSTGEALVFLYKHHVDLIFFDFQIYDSDSLEFIKAIPKEIFVIFISLFWYKNSKLELSNQFQKSLYQARIYSENPNKTEDYFVI